MDRRRADDVRTRATEVARDLHTEHNDAPCGVEKLLELAYIRGVTDGVKTCVDRTHQFAQEVARV